MLVFIGTYTGPKSQGIYRFRFDTSTGAFTPLGVTGGVENPSFLALHPSGRTLFAASEVDKFNNRPTGAVAAFSVAPKTGELTLLNQVSSEGTGPCFVGLDTLARHVLVANYGSGSVAVLPIAGDGRLQSASSTDQHQGSGPNKSRQEGPHAHSIFAAPGGKYALSCDLGLDKVLVYRYDAERGTLTPNDPPAGIAAPGAGPRHLAFHPNGRFVYVVNEMASTVAAYRWSERDGTLTSFQSISTLPDGYTGETTTAQILVHPGGKFLYASNRGHDSIAIFAVDGRSGKLTARGHQPTMGRTPRNFNFDPKGRFLIAASQNSDSLAVFRVDPMSGELTITGGLISVPSPVCVVFGDV